MKCTWLLIFLLNLFAITGFSQEHTLIAADFLAAGNLQEAEKEMKLALSSEEEKNNAYAWHINAYLFKEKYKQNPSKDSEDRAEAIESAKKSLELDTEETYKAQTIKIINYLSSTCLKDAFVLTKSRDTTIIKSALNYYNKYEAAKKIINPEEDFTIKKNDVYLYMANQFEKLYDNDKMDKALIENAILYHKLVLSTNPKDFRSNFNIAVDYYNQAVEEISKIDAKTSFWELIYIQEKSIELFKIALPYMEKAHELEGSHLNTLKGLMQIHRALSNNQLYIEYKNKAEEFVKNNMDNKENIKE